jgi:hypothetical protein
VGAKLPVNGQSRSYAIAGLTYHGDGSIAGMTRNGGLLARKIATASAGVGAGVAGSIVQPTTASTMRQKVVMGICQPL